MRFFPAEAIPKEQIMSVNGAGDTFVGVLVAGLAKREGMEDLEALIELAQKGSRMTLRSHASVAEDLGALKPDLISHTHGTLLGR